MGGRYTDVTIFIKDKNGKQIQHKISIDEKVGKRAAASIEAKTLIKAAAMPQVTALDGGVIAKNVGKTNTNNTVR